MKLRLFILFCLLSVWLFAETDVEKDGLRGAVRTCISSSFVPLENYEELVWIYENLWSEFFQKDFDEQGFLIREEDYADEQTINRGSSYEYDENNLLIAITDYDINGVYYFYQYTYDDSGKILKEERYDAYDDLMNVLLYFYDERGFKIRSEELDSEGNCISSYEYINNEDGKPVEQKVFSENELSSHAKITYDENGNPTQSWLYDGEENLVQTNQIAYNANGDPKELVQNDLTASSTKKYIYSYNDKNKMVFAELIINDDFFSSEEYVYNEQGDDVKFVKFTPFDVVTYIYEYLYDEKGNWTQKIVYENDKPVKKYTRKITYSE